MSEDLDSNIEVKVMPDKKLMHQQLNKSVNIKLSSLLRPWEEKPKHKSGSVKSNRSPTTNVNDQEIEPIRLRSQSHDDMQKIKGLSRSEKKNSSAAISFANMKPVNFVEEEEALKAQKVTENEESKVNPYTAFTNEALNREEPLTPPAG